MVAAATVSAATATAVVAVALAVAVAVAPPARERWLQLGQWSAEMGIMGTAAAWSVAGGTVASGQLGALGARREHPARTAMLALQSHPAI